MANISRFFNLFRAYVRGLTTRGKIIGAVVALIVIIAGVRFLKGGNTAAPADAVRLRQVQTATIADLANGSVPLPLIGEVKSLSEAEIRSESSGSITHLYHRLGDYVGAGTIIAEIENSSQRASLLQAEGALDSAKASIQKSDAVFGESKTGTLDTIRSVYTSNDDLVISKLDPLFSNPRSNVPHFEILTSNSQIASNVQNERVTLGQLLEAEKRRGASLTVSSDLKAEISKAIDETRQVKSYIDDISVILNAGIPSVSFPQATISTYIGVVSGARTSASASLSALSASQQALTAGELHAATPEGSSSADAAIKQAQGAYAAAQAQLEKTLVRAPIGGTLNNLSINLGDFVSAFQQVAIVSNNGALEIVAKITPEDRDSISVGAKVKIEGEYDGHVTRIAPAVDPTTKKIEVKIGLSSPAQFTNGASVHLDITRTPKMTKTGKTISIPVAAIKINADASVVFTVDEAHHLVAHAVKTGPLLGDKIQILSGATPDMRIVEDARGLKDGQEVDVL